METLLWAIGNRCQKKKEKQTEKEVERTKMVKGRKSPRKR